MVNGQTERQPANNKPQHQDAPTKQRTRRRQQKEEGTSTRTPELVCLPSQSQIKEDGEDLVVAQRGRVSEVS